MACPTSAQLEALLEGKLLEAEQEKLAEHLEACPVCMQRLDALAGAVDFSLHEKHSENGARSPLLEQVMADLKAGRDQIIPQMDGESSRHVSESQQVPEVLALLAASDAPGSLGRFDHFEIEEIVDTGGMGVVLKARDSRLGRIVALKLLAPVLAVSQRARQRFVREARAVAAIQDENVVAIYSVDEAQGLPYLVMEFVPGESLARRLKREGPLPAEDIVRIGKQVAAGLAAAHDKGIIHRDIKPANILVERGSGRAKITDFGLARAVDESALTRSGFVAGTPEYLSPEQAASQPADQRSDLFSLGCVLYALCTGSSPFHADSTLAAMRKVCDHHPQAACRINPSIPEWLSQVIGRLLRKRPHERFASAREVLAALDFTDAVAGGQKVAYRAASPAGPQPRGRLFTVVAVLLPLAVLAAIGAKRWLRSTDPRVRTVPPDPLSVLSSTNDRAALENPTRLNVANTARLAIPRGGSGGQIQTAGSLFVDVDATAAPIGSLTALSNSGTLGGFFEARGGEPTVPRIALAGGTGVRGIEFDGNDYMQHVASVGGAVVPAPGELVGPNPTRSIEVWAFNPSIATEETMVAWGRRGGPYGFNMSFNYGDDRQCGAVGHWGPCDLHWSDRDGVPAAGVWHHLVYTYDGRITRVYADGELRNAEQGFIHTPPDFPICLATQLDKDGVTPDASTRGSLTLARVRIHDGVLSSAQILDNYGFEKNDFCEPSAGPVGIVTQPQDTTAFESYPVTFKAGGTGSPPIAYQWFRDGARITGETNVGFTLVPALADNGAVFSCLLSNVASSARMAVSSNATLTVLAQSVVLKHRYNFDEAAGDLTLHDRTGSAHGTLAGGAAFTGAGRLVLDGTNGYVNLPNNILTGFVSVSIEAWVQDDGSAGWARIFDFGNSTAGEDYPIGSEGLGTQYMFLSAPSGWGNLRGASALSGGFKEDVVEWLGSSISTGRLHHVVWVSSGPARAGRLFVDGVEVGENRTATITPTALGPTANNWLGRSQFDNPFFKGQFEEFRIWDGPMTPAQVAASFTAGPTPMRTRFP